MGSNTFTGSFSFKATGIRQGSATAVALPTIPCKGVAFKAKSDNAGGVYIGGPGVTVPAGTTNTTGGWELQAGDSTPVWPCSNLNEFYMICDNAGDDLLYMVFEG